MSRITEAWELIAQQDYAAAAELLEGDVTPEARHALGYAYVGLGRTEEARDLYRDLLAEAGEAAEADARLQQLGEQLEQAESQAAADEVRKLDALAQASQGHQAALECYAQGQTREAHAALAGAFGAAQAAGDAATLGQLWATAGDFAWAEGLSENAHDAYANAQKAFTEAGDAAAAGEMAARLKALGGA